MNLIDVVFYQDTSVVQAWHSYRQLLSQGQQSDVNAPNRAFLDLLAEMAKCVGYKNLKQTQMDNFYTPDAHYWSNDLNYGIQSELLRVLKNSESYSESKKK